MTKRQRARFEDENEHQFMKLSDGKGIAGLHVGETDHRLQRFKPRRSLLLKSCLCAAKKWPGVDVT
jgi:hypothetical protein